MDGLRSRQREIIVKVPLNRTF